MVPSSRHTAPVFQHIPYPSPVFFQIPNPAKLKIWNRIMHELQEPIFNISRMPERKRFGKSYGKRRRSAKGKRGKYSFITDSNKGNLYVCHLK